MALFAIPQDVEERLQELLRSERLHDIRSFLDLTESDEPPLFTRLAQVEWLSRFPIEQRNAYVIAFAQKHVESIRAAARASLSRPQLDSFMCCLSLQDVPDVVRGDRVVVTPCFLTTSQLSREFLDWRLSPARSRDGRAVGAWLERVAPSTFRVFDSRTRSVDPELNRVYVDAVREGGTAYLDTYAAD